MARSSYSTAVIRSAASCTEALLAVAAIAWLTSALLPVLGLASSALLFLLPVLLWLYTLALPPILPANWLAVLAGTPADPLNLLGIGSSSPLVHGVIWSLGVNIAVFSALTARGMTAPGLPRFLRGPREVTDLAGRLWIG